MIITESKQRDGHDAWNVLSDTSGKTYLVRYEGMADDDENTRVWSCACPARKTICRHIAAVIALIDAEDAER